MLIWPKVVQAYLGRFWLHLCFRHSLSLNIGAHSFLSQVLQLGGKITVECFPKSTTVASYWTLLFQLDDFLFFDSLNFGNTSLPATFDNISASLPVYQHKFCCNICHYHVYQHYVTFN